MSPIVVGLAAFACMFTGVQFGMLLRNALPEHHLAEESKEAIRLGTGLIATLTALVLGLVIASAKRAFDEQDVSVRVTAADILMLDRVLDDYGPEAKACRDRIRIEVDSHLGRIWDEGSLPSQAADAGGTRTVESVAAQLRTLSPQTDSQRELRTQALKISDSLQQARWLRIESQGDSIPTTFLVILVFWLTVIFWGIGLFAPRNATVQTVLLVGALSSATAIFLILELERPFDGIVKVSSAPMRYTASHLGE